MNEGSILFLFVFILIGVFSLFRGIHILQKPLDYNSFARSILKLLKSPRSRKVMKLIGLLFILFGTYFLLISFRMFLGLLGFNEFIKANPLLDNSIAIAINISFLSCIPIFLYILFKDRKN